jgi:hypothetical protein
MTQTSSLIFLPRDVLCFVVNYFLDEENQNKSVFRYPRDWMNFMSSSKQYFGQWKRSSQLITIPAPFPEQFYASAEFREKIFRLVENPGAQVQLEELSATLEIDFQVLNNLKKITVGGISEASKVVPRIVDVEEIVLYEFPIEDLSFWSRAKSVTFNPAEDIRMKSFDLAPLQHIEKGVFPIPYCVNYHLLAGLKSLTFSGCESIKDVSCFKDIPVLALNNCPGITDVSSLGNVHKLDLSGCQNIVDVSPLKRVHILNLSMCLSVKDLSALEWVYSFAFRYFDGNDISGLKNVVILDIVGATDVSDITMLQKVEEINIRGCDKITSLRGLTKLKRLTMNRRNHITFDQETLQLLLRLDVNCDFQDIFGGIDPMHGSVFHFWEPDTLLALQTLRDLTIHKGLFFDEFPFMANLRSLCISDCDSIATLSIPAIPSLGSLDISSCERLHSLRILGDSKYSLKFPVYSLTISGCKSLKEIFIDRKVFTGRIVGHLLETVEATQQIGYLELFTCSNYFREVINRQLVVELKLLLEEEEEEIDEMAYSGSDGSVGEGEEEAEFNDDDEEELDEEEDEEGSGEENDDR